MHPTDKYRSFRQLVAVEKEGSSFQIRMKCVSPRIAIIVPHGGGIEAGTSELAGALAANDFSLYCFEGLKANGNHDLHITSTRFDEPKCIKLVEQSQIVVVIHGCGGKSETVYVGGRDENLKTKLIHAIQMAGINAVRDNTRHRGNDPRNICNKGTSQRGVQLELTEALRQKMFKSLYRNDRKRMTSRFNRFISCVREALLEVNTVESSKLLT